MEKIDIITKPDCCSFEQIHDLIFLAHEQNRLAGLYVKTAEMSGEELERHIGANGQCFVAYDGDKLVGVTAVRAIERNSRFSKGRIADQILVAVHPNYAGMHISSKLHEAVVQYSNDNDLNKIELRTAANNQKMQIVCKKWGFYHVDFKAYAGIDHYTVVMMKWLEGNPNIIRIKCYYCLKKMYIKLKYKLSN